MAVLGRLSRRGCLALPVLRGPRRAPGTSPMSPPASWRLPRAERRPGDRPRRLRRGLPGCPVRSRGTRLRRPLLVCRGAGMCPPSSCRRRVPRDLRDREHHSLRAHRPLLVVRRLRLHLGLQVCRIRPAARGSRVLRVRRVLVARVRLSSRVCRVGPVLRIHPVPRVDRRPLGRRALLAGCNLLVLPVSHGPRPGPCITRKPCCPRPQWAAPACLRRRRPPALPAPQGRPLEPQVCLGRLRALRSRCRPARCRPRLRAPYRSRARCLRPGSPRPGSPRPASRCRDSPRRDTPRRGSLCPGSRCRDTPRRDSPPRDTPPRVRPRPVSPGPVSPQPTATPSRRSPLLGPGIRPSFVTVRRTGRSSS